jgi:cytochrome b561
MGWVVKATPRSLYPRERDLVPTVQEAGWVAGPVWTGAGNFCRTAIRSQTLQPIASRYTDSVIAAHIIHYYFYRCTIIIIIIILVVIIISSSSIRMFWLPLSSSSLALKYDAVNCFAFRWNACMGDRPYSRSLAAQDITNTGIYFLLYSCIMHAYIGECKISYAFRVLHVIQESKNMEVKYSARMAVPCRSCMYVTN